MQAKEQLLLEFLLPLIDIQIKRYGALSNIALGPDAQMNAMLVCQELQELQQFSETLLKAYETKPLNDITFTNIFNQIYFYVDQEYFRGYAGWLIDENNIHVVEFKRLKQQLEHLKKIANLTNIDIPNPPAPSTPNQKQCQHDSYAVVQLIVSTTLQLTEANNKFIPLPDVIPIHAQHIFRKHAAENGRYQRPEISSELRRLDKECQAWLATSKLEKSLIKLTQAEAAEYAISDRQHFDLQLARFKQLSPDSDLSWYRIGSMKPQTKQDNHKYSFFTNACAITVSMVLVIAAYYIKTSLDETATSAPSF